MSDPVRAFLGRAPTSTGAARERFATTSIDDGPPVSVTGVSDDARKGTLAHRVRVAADAMGLHNVIIDEANIVRQVRAFIVFDSEPTIRKDALNTIMARGSWKYDNYTDAIMAAYFTTKVYTRSTIPAWLNTSAAGWLQEGRFMSVRAIFLSNADHVLAKLNWSLVTSVAALRDFSTFEVVWPHAHGHRPLTANLIINLANHPVATLQTYMYWIWANTAHPTDTLFVNMMPGVLARAAAANNWDNARIVYEMIAPKMAVDAKFFERVLQEAVKRPPALENVLEYFKDKMLENAAMALSAAEFPADAQALLRRELGDKVVFREIVDLVSSDDSSSSDAQQVASGVLDHVRKGTVSHQIRAAANTMGVHNAVVTDENVLVVVDRYIDVKALPVFRKTEIIDIMEAGSWANDRFTDPIMAAYFLTHPYNTLPDWLGASVIIFLHHKRFMAVRAIFRANPDSILKTVDWRAAAKLASRVDFATLQVIWPHAIVRKPNAKDYLRALGVHPIATLKLYVYWVWRHISNSHNKLFVEFLPGAVVQAEINYRSDSASLLVQMAVEHIDDTRVLYTSLLRAAARESVALKRLLHDFKTPFENMVRDGDLQSSEFTGETRAMMTRFFGDNVFSDGIQDLVTDDEYDSMSFAKRARATDDARITFAELRGNANDSSIDTTMLVLSRTEYFGQLHFPRDQIVVYARFIALKIKHHDVEGPRMALAPSFVVEEVWHAHMLLPQDYVRMCADLFATKTVNGRERITVLYHDQSVEDVNDRRMSVAATKVLYERVFVYGRQQQDYFEVQVGFSKVLKLRFELIAIKTIASLKAELAERTGRFRVGPLFYGDIALDDAKTLEQCTIKQDAVIREVYDDRESILYESMVYRRCSIQVLMPDGVHVTVEYSSMDTVVELAGKLQKGLQFEFRDTILGPFARESDLVELNTLALGYYGIKVGDVIRGVTSV